MQLGCLGVYIVFEFRAAIVCLRITEYFSSVRLRDWQVRGGALVDLVLLVLEKKTNTMSATQLAFWLSCKRTNKPVCSMIEGSVRAWHWHGLACLGQALTLPSVIEHTGLFVRLQDHQKASG